MSFIKFKAVGSFVRRRQREAYTPLFQNTAGFFGNFHEHIKHQVLAFEKILAPPDVAQKSQSDF